MARGLAEFVALVEGAGGRQRVLLVAEGGRAEPGAPSPRALLEGFARDLFGPPEDPAADPAASRAGVCGGAGRQVRLRGSARRLGCCCASGPPPPSPPPPPPCRLLFVLFGAGSLLRAQRAPQQRRRLREILRDVRRQLRPARPAVVGVVVLRGGPPQDGDGEAEAAARAQLEGLLRQVFRAPRGDPRQPGPLHAAAYRPADAPGAAAAAAAAEARQAACRALRDALQRQAADGLETKKQKLPIFLQCLPWGRRRQQRKGDFGTAANKFKEDAPQDPEECVALTNMAPNRNSEEAYGGTGT